MLRIAPAALSRPANVHRIPVARKANAHVKAIVAPAVFAGVLIPKAAQEIAIVPAAKY